MKSDNNKYISGNGQAGKWLENDSAILRQLPVGFYNCSRYGEITSFNETAVSLWGRIPRPGKGLWCGGWKTFYTDGTPMPKEQSPMARVMRDGKVLQQEEVIFERPDHSFRRLLVLPRAVYNEQGELHGGLSTLVDISYRDAIEIKQSFLSVIMDDSDDAIISSDLNGVITNWNAGAERIFGYNADEILGRSINILVPPERLEEENHILLQLRKGKKIDHFQTVEVTKSGNKVPISLTVSPIKDGMGRIVGASRIARDITDQAQHVIPKHKSNLKAIDMVSKPVSEKMEIDEILQQITDSTTKLTGAAFGAFFYNAVNQDGEAYMLYTLSGAPKEMFEKLGMPRNTEIFGPTFRGEGIVRSDDITKDSRYGRNAPHYGMPKGHLPVTSYLAVPVMLSNGRVLGGLFFGHPERGQFTANHEMLVGDIAAQAAVSLDHTRLYEAAVQLNTKKNEFVALASHELKTPLTTLSGYLQLLKKEESNPVSLMFIEKATSQVAKLIKLVDDLLEISKIEAGKLAFQVEEFDLKQLLMETVETVKLAGNSHIVEVDVPEGDVMVRADRDRLEQVLNNLLGNAIKYSPGAARVWASIERHPDSVLVKIRDEGIGMTPAQQEKLFTPFYRAEEIKHIGGLGIGLYLAKEIIEKHGGNISVASEFGKGSEFSFRLPSVNKRG